MVRCDLRQRKKLAHGHRYTGDVVSLEPARPRPLGACAAAAALVASLLLAGSAGCGVVPVHRGPGVPLPPSWTYDGPHGRPLAFGGDVCAVTAPHRHSYPPSPQAAFAETPRGWHDTRPRWPFFDPHPHVRRTCFRQGWHMHLERPVSGLLYDGVHGGWRVPGQDPGQDPAQPAPRGPAP